MRIVAGKYKSRNVICMQGRNTRPTSDKVRESIFDVLESKFGLEGAEILDLFAGSGALGIEALSRGAAAAVFIEKNADSAMVIKKNLSFVTERTEVYNTDWKVAVRKLLGRKFDFIFVDPPYGLRLEQAVATEITEKELLNEGGCIIIEHSSDNAVEFNGNVFEVYSKKYSGTSVTYLTYKSAVASQTQEEQVK